MCARAARAESLRSGGAAPRQAHTVRVLPRWIHPRAAQPRQARRRIRGQGMRPVRRVRAGQPAHIGQTVAKGGEMVVKQWSNGGQMVVKWCRIARRAAPVAAMAVKK